MTPFCLCLFLLAILLGLQNVFKIRAAWGLVFWMVPAGCLFTAWIGSDRYFQAAGLFCLLAAVFFQDLKTMYFGERWLWGIPFLAGLAYSPYTMQAGSALVKAGLYLAAIAPAFFMFILERQGKCGQADVIALALAGLLLGWRRLTICLLIACAAGIVYGGLSGRRRIPFLCFLALGFFISWSCGYTLFDFWLNLPGT